MNGQRISNFDLKTISFELIISGSKKPLAMLHVLIVEGQLPLVRCHLMSNNYESRMLDLEKRYIILDLIKRHVFSYKI